MTIELRLPGPVEAVGDDGPIDLSGGRPTRLLVALATADGHHLSLDQLVDRCFDPDDQLDDPVAAVRTAVRRVRRGLGNDAEWDQFGPAGEPYQATCPQWPSAEEP